MIGYIYKRAFTVLKSMPIKLWGLSLLNGLLTILILIFGALPIIIIPVIATLSAGVAMIYLDGYNGKEVYSDQLFAGFKNFKHVAGGMCWKKLWLLIWFLVPIAGLVMIFIKSLEYAFTPYILLTEKDVSATEALRKSKQDTNGYKASMFLAVILPSIAYIVVSLILSLLAQIPIVGVLFALVSVLLSLIYSLFAPLFLGLVRAGFYEYAKNPVPIYTAPKRPAPQYTAPQPPVQQSAPTGNDAASSGVTYCPTCGTENTQGSSFCKRCGAKL